jgi:acyl carrier protein
MNTPPESTTRIAERLRLCFSRFPLGEHTDTPIAQLGLDSMDTVELLCVIHEEFGVRLSVTDFNPQQTTGGLVEAIAEKATK